MSEQSVISIDDNCDEAVVTRKKETFECIFANFSNALQRSQPNLEIKSSKFTVRIGEQITEWQLSVYPRGYINKYVSMFVKNLSKLECYVKPTFAILNSQKKMVLKKTTKYQLFRKGTSSGVTNFVEQDILSKNKEEWLAGDKLTVECEILVDKTELYIKMIEKGRVEEFDDLGMLFNNEKLSDVRFLFSKDPRILFAHKHVVKKKMGPLFCIMLGIDSVKKEEREPASRSCKSIYMKDFSFETVNEILRYIYTGEAFVVSAPYQIELLEAANKYKIEELKQLCERQLVQNLSIANCVQYLKNSINCCADHLKASSVDFIVKNSYEMLENVELVSISNSNPELELYRKMALNLKMRLDEANCTPTKVRRRKSNN